MHFTKLLLFAFLVCALASASSATIRRVGLSQTYSTLNTAYTAASDDDTVLVSPGTYAENITSTKRLTWTGAGFDKVTIIGHLAFNAGSSGSTLEGFRIQPTSLNVYCLSLAANVDLTTVRRCWICPGLGQSVNAYGTCITRTGTPGGSVTIEDCIFEPYAYSSLGTALSFAGETAVVRNCIFYRHVGMTNVSAITGSVQALTLENCVVLNCATFNISSGTITCRNNIQYDGSLSWGTYPATAAFSYNASQLSPPGSNGITLSTLPFAAYDATNHYQYGISDLHLASGSACINTGDPAILDLDGTRSDMGTYGGQMPLIDTGAPNYPFTIGLTIPSSIISGQPLPVNALGRIGRGY